MKAIFSMILVLLLASVASADCFRCDVGIVCTGESRIQVLSKCAQPDDSEVISINFSGNSARKGTALYYNCGEGRFMKTLIFDGSTLVRIESSGYGSGSPKCE